MRTIVPEGLREIWTRRLGSSQTIDRFFSPSPADLPAPSVLPGLTDTADRIEAAIRTNDRILIFGHDDPDGITSCAILMEALEA
ncbi:MAG: hypothetical protein HKN12_08335, partial [Gemmatimonadetes bacterium]|nr:hypothetical protein [Gemmatimonadota bacterium]